MATRAQLDSYDELEAQRKQARTDAEAQKDSYLLLATGQIAVSLASDGPGPLLADRVGDGLHVTADAMKVALTDEERARLPEAEFIIGALRASIELDRRLHDNYDLSLGHTGVHPRSRLG